MAGKVVDVAVYGAAAVVAVGGLLYRYLLADRRQAQATSFARAEGFTLLSGCGEQPSTLFTVPSLQDDVDFSVISGITPSAGPSVVAVETPSDLVRQLAGCIPTSSGYSAERFLVKREGGSDWCIFDYTTISRDSKGNRSYSYYGVLLARLPLHFQRVELRPENILYKIGRAFGMQEVDFEVEQFNKKYFVTGADRKFCYDLINPKAIEVFLKFPPRHWQFDGPFVVLLRSGFYDYYDSLRAMEEIREVVGTIEPFVRQECAFQGVWQPLMGTGAAT